jgi:glycosyltransferase involved in cell wall biosynthesis
LIRAQNGGKGAAVLDGLREAAAQGFTHVLTMDADGQHPAAAIPEFMALSHQHPEAMITGVPSFDRSAPRLRVVGRQVSNGWAHLETLWIGMVIPFSAFRVCPSPSGARFTMERGCGSSISIGSLVRLSWRGCSPSRGRFRAILHRGGRLRTSAMSATSLAHLDTRG